MVKKIDHINIVVKDLEGVKKFFLELGFVVKKTGILQGSWIDKITQLKNVKAEYFALEIPDSQTSLELLKFYSPESESHTESNSPNQLGFRHMAIEVKNIEQIVNELKKKKVVFLSDIQEYKPANKKLCYFLGPENLLLELAEYET